MERFESAVRVNPARLLGSVDDERSNDNDDCTDNQYGEPDSIATCRNLAGRNEAEDKGKQ